MATQLARVNNNYATLGLALKPRCKSSPLRLMRKKWGTKDEKEMGHKGEQK